MDRQHYQETGPLPVHLEDGLRGAIPLHRLVYFRNAGAAAASEPHLLQELSNTPVPVIPAYHPFFPERFLVQRRQRAGQAEYFYFIRMNIELDSAKVLVASMIIGIDHRFLDSLVRKIDKPGDLSFTAIFDPFTNGVVPYIFQKLLDLVMERADKMALRKIRTMIVIKIHHLRYGIRVKKIGVAIEE